MGYKNDSFICEQWYDSLRNNLLEDPRDYDEDDYDEDDYDDDDDLTNSMRMKKTFNVPIFFGKITVIISENFSLDFKKYFPNHAIPKNINNYEAFTYILDRHNNWLFIKANPSLSIIAHESIHITNSILNDCGVIPSFSNDETQAYLLGWIVNKITKILNNEKKRINGGKSC